MKSLTLKSSASIEAAADKPATVRILAYSGGVMRPPGWGPLVIDLGGLELPASLPLLLDHQNNIGSVAGSGSPTVEGGALVIVGELARDTEAGEKVIKLSRAGVALQASVGVEPSKTETVEPGVTVAVNGRKIRAGRDGLVVIRAGELREISFVALGADKHTSVAIAASLHRGKKMLDQKSFEAWVSSVAPEADLSDHDVFAGLHANYHGRSEATPADQAAAKHFIAASGGVELDDEEIRLRRIERSMEREERLKKLEASIPMAHTVPPSGRQQPAGRVIEAALCLQGGLTGLEKQFPEQVLDQADRMVRGGLSLQTTLMGAAVAGGYDARPGESISTGNIKNILTAAFAPSIRAQGWSGLSISNVLSNVANKYLLDGFQEAGDEWKSISAVKSVTNFKTATFVRLLDAMEFEKLGAAGEIKHGTLDDATMTAKADTYAKMLAITRQDIINDDLGALTDIPRKLGLAGGMKFRRSFWSTFLASDDFFHTNNNNVLTGSGSSLDSAGVGLTNALKAFRGQKTPTADGAKLIGGKPAVLLAPPAVEIAARRLLNSSNVIAGTATAAQGASNPFMGLAELVVADWIGAAGGLSGASDSVWYLFRSPSLAPAMLVAALNGRVEPTVDTAEADFNTLGIQMRGYSDVGCSRGEPLCGLQAAGTA